MSEAQITPEGLLLQRNSFKHTLQKPRKLYSPVMQQLIIVICCCLLNPDDSKKYKLGICGSKLIMTEL